MNAKSFLNLFLALCMALGALAFAPVKPAHAAAIITVNTLSDVSDGSCSDGDCTLRDAIDLAAAGDTINFSVNGTITMNGVEFYLDKNLTIDGPGADKLTISGNDGRRVFGIYGVHTIVMEGLTIAHGKVTNEHGAGIWNHGYLTLNNVVVTGNDVVSTGSIVVGGGIYNSGSLTMNGGAVMTNTAHDLGGGIYSDNGSIANLNAVLISGNSALDTDSSGGGMFARPEASIKINNSSIINNSAKYHGGGMVAETSLTMTNSLIANNSVTSPTINGSGGGIVLHDGSSYGNVYLLTNVTISGNSVSNSANTAFAGGIQLSNGALTMNNVTIANNSSQESGGGIFAGGSNPKMRNSIIAGNTTTQDSTDDCTGTIISLDYNLVQVDTCLTNAAHDIKGVSPLLNPLADNGGPSMTHSLGAGSAALNAGDNVSCASTDQRGIARPQGGVCDMGAFEHVNSAPSGLALSANSIAENLPIGTLVGSLSTTDANPSDAHTYSFCGGANDASFSIAGNALKTAAIFDYETKSSYAICIRTNDGYGGLFNKNFTVNVSNASETLTAIFRSAGAQDGWTLESGENTSKGGTVNSSATTLRLGDNAAKKQYRSTLSFATGADLPDNAVITKVTLKVKRQGISGGGDPVAALQGFMVDFRKGSFGQPTLQAGDFQAAANKSYGPFAPALSSGWYAFNLTTAKAYVNKLATGNGLTQIRLRFQLDDNDNGVANVLSLFSGEAGAANRPQLIVEYYVP